MPASGQPCTPLALIYSDSGLTQALANPTTTDGLGNYFFYAAPGRYEIEISGPNITTKQLPNVVLPNDPSSPTFSGAVSAFSLSLGGNLTVSGNTTVVGSLASGTLTLNNQSTVPGAASSGTVNLYTKTADMRLYYKDQTGTEIGPLGPGTGAQTNVSNTFTATQNVDADFHTKGPNPSALRRVLQRIHTSDHYVQHHGQQQSDHLLRRRQRFSHRTWSRHSLSRRRADHAHPRRSFSHLEHQRGEQCRDGHTRE
jgi:hypothetical protein